MRTAAAKTRVSSASARRPDTYTVVRLVVCSVSALTVAAATISAAVAGPANATTYRSQVNGICRSYTPRLKRVEAQMRSAIAAGDRHAYAYDVGVLVGISLVEGVRVEKTPVPADSTQRMVRPLRLLHSTDGQLRRVVARALAGDLAGVLAQAAPLAKLQGPLNSSFDAVGLRDCGSNQS
jgi:hypothetical protein